MRTNPEPLSAAEFRRLYADERALWQQTEAIPGHRGRRIRADVHFAAVASNVAHLKAEGLWSRFYIHQEYAFCRDVPYWEHYCRRYLPFPRRYCDRLIRVDTVYTALVVASFGHADTERLTPAQRADLPQHPKHVEIVGLADSEDWSWVWENVRRKHKPITEALIRAEVERMKSYRKQGLQRQIADILDSPFLHGV